MPINSDLARAYLTVIREQIKAGSKPQILWRNVSASGGYGCSYQTREGDILNIQDIGESDPYLQITHPELKTPLPVESPQEGQLFYETYLLSQEELSEILKNERRRGKDRRNERGRAGGRRLEDRVKQ